MLYNIIIYLILYLVSRVCVCVCVCAWCLYILWHIYVKGLQTVCLTQYRAVSIVHVDVTGYYELFHCPIYILLPSYVSWDIRFVCHNR